jgi:hypothetical protein
MENIVSTKATLEAARMTTTFFVEKISIGPFEAKRQVSYELTLLAKCSLCRKDFHRTF